MVSQRIAKKYFGDADPIGKIVTVGRGGCGNDAACTNSQVALRVVGVMRDLPHNTQIEADILMPNTSLADRMDQDTKKNWLSNNGSFGYVTLAPGADPARVLPKLKPILDGAIDISRFTNVKIPGQQNTGAAAGTFPGRASVHRPVWRHARAGKLDRAVRHFDHRVLIVLVACFNFMNLATARATIRAREISLRKTLGATRQQLVLQFLGESVLMSLIALVFALALVEVLLPAYGSFLGVPLALHYLQDWRQSCASWQSPSRQAWSAAPILRWCFPDSARPMCYAQTSRAVPAPAGCAQF